MESLKEKREFGRGEGFEGNDLKNLEKEQLVREPEEGRQAREILQKTQGIEREEEEYVSET